MKNPNLKFIFILFYCYSFSAKAQTPAIIDSSWNLVFRMIDSIYPPGQHIDTSKWVKAPISQESNKATRGYCFPPDSIFDIAYETRDNFSTNYVIDTSGSGQLNLIGRKEDITGLCWTDSLGSFTLQFRYTTASLFTTHKFRFGYFETRFRVRDVDSTNLSANKGLGPNFWLYANDTGIVRNSEIDIFEIQSVNNEYTHNLHFNYDTWPDNIDSSDFVTDGPKTFNSQFHTAGAEWRPDRIDWYYDGNLIHSYTGKYCDSLIAMPVILNLWTGSGNTCAIDTAYTVLPYTFEVDYVKVWQLKQACDTIKSICYYTPATYESKVWQQLTIGGFTCNSPVQSGNDQAFRATDFVEADEGFSVDALTNCLLDVIPCQDQVANQKIVLPLNKSNAGNRYHKKLYGY